MVPTVFFTCPGAVSLGLPLVDVGAGSGFTWPGAVSLGDVRGIVAGEVRAGVVVAAGLAVALGRVDSTGCVGSGTVEPGRDAPGVVGWGGVGSGDVG